MKAVITDKEGNICGRKEETLADITDGEIKNKVIEVVLDKKCDSLSYGVSLVSGQKELAEESGKLPKVFNEPNLLSYLYFGAPAFLVILLAFYFSGKKNRSRQSFGGFVCRRSYNVLRLGFGRDADISRVGRRDQHL